MASQMSQSQISSKPSMHLNKIGLKTKPKANDLRPEIGGKGT